MAGILGKLRRGTGIRMRKPQLSLLAGLLMVAAVSAAVAQAPRPDASTPTGALRGGPAV